MNMNPQVYPQFGDIFVDSLDLGLAFILIWGSLKA